MLLVDKPEGMTSHEAVIVARRALGTRRIGHTGTLDPFATGLLLLCVGRFTRAAEYFHLLPKTYDAEMRLGVETDTHDRTGRVTGEVEVAGLDGEHVARVVHDLRGESLQRPPAFSAKRVRGRRAHREARVGRPPVLDPVPIAVHRVSVEAVELPLVRFSVTVSTGTYVRGLARDVGRTLGCGAHLTSLRRTEIGPFLVGAARPPEDLAAGHGGDGGWLRPAEALVWMRRRVVVAAEAEALRNGRAVPRGRLTPLEEASGSDSGPIAAVMGDRLVAIATAVDAELRPRKVFD